MPARPKLLKITLTYKVGGEIHTKDVDPDQASALFWTDHTVSQMLASYYLPEHPGLPKTPGMTAGKVADEWNTPTAEGSLPVVMVKYPQCGAGPLV